MANFVKGRVKKLYPSHQGCFVAIEYLPEFESKPRPEDNYFEIKLSHPNYNSLYSLAVAAAVNHYVLSIGTRVSISPTTNTEVWYLVVDWD